MAALPIVRSSLHKFVGLAALLTAVAAPSANAQSVVNVSADTAGPRQKPSLSRPFRVCAGGDVTLGTNLDPVWASESARRLAASYGLSADPDSLAPQLRPFVSGADLVLLNIEGAIGEGRAPRKCSPKSTSCYAFRQPPNTARALRAVVDSSVTVVGNVANNHSHDAGPSGRDSTIALLDAAGIFVTGADTLATPVVLSSGDTVGVLGFYTDNDSPDARDLPAVRRHVARAARRYGTVIVTMHLGAEGPAAQRTRNAREMFLKTIDRGNPVGFADAAFAGGATLVIGHGPHVVRAAQWRGTRMVFYSLGNLLTYGPFNLREPMNRGVVACATVDSAGFVSLPELRPTMQLAPGVLQADPERRTIMLIDSLSALDFPMTGATVDASGVIGKRSPLAEEPPMKAAPSKPKPKMKTPPKRPAAKKKRAGVSRP
jgi:poly-gamma-glutamate capsule biosynthesis protein CapA/YwtB (metallophosphatase superfamily)